MIFGHARVSTDGWSVDAQVKTLRAAGAEKIFRETASGAKTDRTQLRPELDAIGNAGARFRSLGEVAPPAQQPGAGP